MPVGSLPRGSSEHQPGVPGGIRERLYPTVILEPRPVERDPSHSCANRPFRHHPSDERGSRAIATIVDSVTDILLQRGSTRHRAGTVRREHLRIDMSWRPMHAQPRYLKLPDVLAGAPCTSDPCRFSVSGHVRYFCFFFASFRATISPAYLTPFPLYGSGGL